MEGSVLQQKPKRVLKSLNKTEQLVGMSKSKREKIQIKNHPSGHYPAAGLLGALKFMQSTVQILTF